MNLSKLFTKRVSPLIALVISLIISLFVFGCVTSNSQFFTTQSPQGTYTVNLRGGKERPFFLMTNEVRFDVVKNQKAFIQNQYLHSGDHMDISFELGYPDFKWTQENILHFFRGRDLNKDSSSDSIIVVNKTNSIIKYVKLFSDRDKFLLFDLQPESETKLVATTPPILEFRSIYVQGEYSNQLHFEKGNSLNFDMKTYKASTYYVSISDEGVTFVEQR